MSEKLTENDEVLEDEKDQEYEIVEELKKESDETLKDDDAKEDSDDVDEEREAIRERRRIEKQERKERKEKAISRDKLELDFLRRRNDDLERRISQQEERTTRVDIDNIDARIYQANNEVSMAEQVIAKAVAAGNGDDVAQALRLRDQAILRAQQLAAHKQNVAYRPKPQQSVDDMTIHHAKQFMSDHPWYNAQGADEDSGIVLAIDQSLSKEGYDSRSEDYWDELRYRVQKRLPEKFKEVSRSPRGGPQVGSGKEYAPSTTKKEIFVSPERVQALKDAGVWEDPVLRMKYVKRYAEYDKHNK
jgi:hypothetical protein